MRFGSFFFLEFMDFEKVLEDILGVGESWFLEFVWEKLFCDGENVEKLIVLKVVDDDV